MTELEERIIAFVAEERGTAGSRVDLDSSLAQDLGMDGDDAVEFFEKFGTEFHIDLTALCGHWNQHFASEGCLGEPPLGCAVVVVAAAFAGGLLHMAVYRIPAWASIIALIAVFGWICRKFFNYYEPEEKIPITVQDLVDAAASGKWVKQYGGP
jgi:acyl carrier protein